jgi:hypothetical protein
LEEHGFTQENYFGGKLFGEEAEILIITGKALYIPGKNIQIN